MTKPVLEKMVKKAFPGVPLRNSVGSEIVWGKQKANDWHGDGRSSCLGAVCVEELLGYMPQLDFFWGCEKLNELLEPYGTYAEPYYGCLWFVYEI